MQILNLGCGVKTSDRAINIDWSINLRIANNRFLFWIANKVLSQERSDRLRLIGNNVLVHDLSKGIPFADGSVDAVYHSHTLEHIDRDFDDPKRDAALSFIKDCYRVLKPGGILRVVVPDFERRCIAYIRNLEACEHDRSAWSTQDLYVGKLVGQAAMKLLPNTKHEHPLIQRTELFLLGDARARGQTHQWEYDRFNLQHLLNLAGFEKVKQVDFKTSSIDGWNEMGLDLDESGNEYKPDSLYFEAIR